MILCKYKYIILNHWEIKDKNEKPFTRCCIIYFSPTTLYSVHCTMSMCILNIKKIMNIFSTFRKDEIGHTAQRYFATKKDPKTSFNHCSFSAVPIRIQFNKATNNFFLVKMSPKTHWAANISVSQPHNFMQLSLCSNFEH